MRFSYWWIFVPAMVSPEQIHALIIGINEYSKYKPLKGAVRDASDFKQYLLDCQVPAGNIKLLVDGDATRSAIVEHIDLLKTNDAIERDNAAIIIFFAGHGASAPTPSEWDDWQSVQAGGQIEQLCPVDIGDTVSDKVVEGIPDYNIRVWLDELSCAKGNNITVILDCCHSGGMNRDDDIGPDWVLRCIEDPPKLSLPPSPPDHVRVTVPRLVDSGTRTNSSVLEFLGTGRESHVLLAACNRNQTARESQGRGHFTAALLNVLGNYSLESLTYQTLMDLLVMPRYADAKEHQTPHCDGRFIRRRLFDSQSPEVDADLILCHRVGGATSLTLQAGAIHGVTVGSEYEILGLHSTQALHTAQKATVDTVRPFTSILHFAPDFEMPSASASNERFRDVHYARLSKEADLEVRLYCSDETYLDRLIALPIEGPPIIKSKTSTDADMVLILTETHVFFERGSKTLIIEPDIGFPSRLSGEVEKDNLEHVRYVVKSYTRFMKHLTRTAPQLPNGRDVIKLSLRRLEGSRQDIHPVDEDLLEGKSGVVTVISNDAQHGLTLTNLSEVPLYAYVFFFYPATAEIELWYSARQGAGDADAFPDTPLEPGQELGAGYGNGGVHPLSFEMSEDQSIDVSLLKVFVTASPTDMKSLEQPSAFDNQRRRKPKKTTPRDLPSSFWMAKTITIVEKAKMDASF